MQQTGLSPGGYAAGFAKSGSGSRMAWGRAARRADITVRWLLSNLRGLLTRFQLQVLITKGGFVWLA